VDYVALFLSGDRTRPDILSSSRPTSPRDSVQILLGDKAKGGVCCAHRGRGLPSTIALLSSLAARARVCVRLVGMSVVRIREVLRSGRQADKTVSKHLHLTDSDNRPSKVMNIEYLQLHHGTGGGMPLPSLK